MVDKIDPKKVINQELMISLMDHNQVINQDLMEVHDQEICQGHISDQNQVISQELTTRGYAKIIWLIPNIPFPLICIFSKQYQTIFHNYL